MNAILSFFKNNKAATLSVLSVALVVFGALAMQGCTLGDMIRHDVPKDMQEFNDSEPKVSLNDAPFVVEDYVQNVERNLRQFAEANERANLIFDFVNSAMTIGIEELGNSPIPGATIFSGLLLGLGGLMTRKPGTAKEIMEEKMASFNAGQDRALEQAKHFVSEENLRSLVAALKEATPE